jgi:hypothetical protein
MVLSCPVTTCTYNQERKCRLEEVSLKFRAAIDFPGSGTVVYLECCQQELPQDRPDCEREPAI